MSSMPDNKELMRFLQDGLTPYHAVRAAAAMLDAAGFTRSFGEPKCGERVYYTDGGTLIACTKSKKAGKVKIAASHSDSPCLKVKGGVPLGSRIKKLNVEPYGGGINYTFFDEPLKLAGRAFFDDKDGVREELVTSKFNVTLPSLAVHLNRAVNENFAPNPQTEMSPLLGEDGDYLAALNIQDALDYDLFAVPCRSPYLSGTNDEFLSSPRIDNLTSVFASIVALIESNGAGVNIVYVSNHEEIGSLTGEGAFSPALKCMLNDALKFGNAPFALSIDNSHAVHPNYEGKSDPVAAPVLGGGIVIKHNAKYATTGYSAALTKKIFRGLDVQDFYSRSDAPCGSTIGNIIASGTGIPVCDIGIAQLAMHSAVETAAISDVGVMIDGIKRLFEF